MTETQSLADVLKQRREQMTHQREPRLFQAPPPYGAELQIKYRVLSREEEKDIRELQGKLARAGTDRPEVVYACATLSRACVEICTERDGQVVGLHDAEDLGEGPVTWGDPRFADFLALELDGKPTARKVIEAVIGQGPEGDKRIEGHHAEVVAWMNSLGDADDQDF